MARTKAEVKEDALNKCKQLSEVELFDQSLFLKTFYELDKILKHESFGCRYFLSTLKVIKNGVETVVHSVLFGSYGSYENMTICFCCIQGGLFVKKVFYLEIPLAKQLHGFKAEGNELTIELNNGDKLVLVYSSPSYYFDAHQTMLRDAMNYNKNG